MPLKKVSTLPAARPLTANSPGLVRALVRRDGAAQLGQLPEMSPGEADLKAEQLLSRPLPESRFQGAAQFFTGGVRRGFHFAHEESDVAVHGSSVMEALSGLLSRCPKCL